MKSFLFLALLGLSACKLSDLIGGGSSSPVTPKEREGAVTCPDAAECEGKYKTGVVCLPSGEHHSEQGKCPFKK